MTPNKECVLVVDDETRMLRLMQRILQLEEYKVMTAENGEAALDIVTSSSLDLVLLDIMMPGIDGYAVCRQIREFSQVPIIMVTAKEADEEKVRGLDAGADDYVVKPFSSGELAARVRAVLRRSKQWGESHEPTFHCGELGINFRDRTVTVGEQRISATATEYRLLSYLARNAGRVLTPVQILDNVWGEEYGGETHLLQVHVARLRQKLKEDTKNPRYILTRPGIGYTMAKHS